MIKNEKQYRITKDQRDADENPSQVLRHQFDAYERQHAGKTREVVLEAIDDLPKNLIRARIASGITQEAALTSSASRLRMGKPSRLIRKG